MGSEMCIRDSIGSVMAMTSSDSDELDDEVERLLSVDLRRVVSLAKCIIAQGGWPLKYNVCCGVDVVDTI